MPLIFSYGALQQDDVQIATFGRLLQGQRDELPRYELSSVPIADPHVLQTTGKTHHKNVLFNGRDDSRVTGTVFEVTEMELAETDRYERGASYQRITVVLASEKQVWVYVHCRSAATP
jgi:gamma-glutamylcyclotransferase (GGCT)/AIG2-like uncharacterized protein YtfP